MRTLYMHVCLLNWELTRNHGADGAPGLVYTNSVPDQHSLYPGGQHTLALFTKCVTPVGLDCHLREQVTDTYFTEQLGAADWLASAAGAQSHQNDLSY